MATLSKGARVRELCRDFYCPENGRKQRSGHGTYYIVRCRSHRSAPVRGSGVTPEGTARSKSGRLPAYRKPVVAVWAQPSLVPLGQGRQISDRVSVWPCKQDDQGSVTTLI